MEARATSIEGTLCGVGKGSVADDINCRMASRMGIAFWHFREERARQTESGLRSISGRDTDVPGLVLLTLSGRPATGASDGLTALLPEKTRWEQVR
jgi:hypothetical protein